MSQRDEQARDELVTELRNANLTTHLFINADGGADARPATDEEAAEQAADWVMGMFDHLTGLLSYIKVDGEPAPCKMTHTPPFDFAQCETHDTTFALGDKCKFDGRDMLDVYADEAQEQRARAVRAEMERDRALAALNHAKAGGEQWAIRHHETEIEPAHSRSAAEEGAEALRDTSWSMGDPNAHVVRRLVGPWEVA